MVISVLYKVETVQLSKPNLQQVVIKALFADSDEFRRLLKAKPSSATRRLNCDASVQLSPNTHTLDNKPDFSVFCQSTFFSIGLLVSQSCFRKAS